MQRALLCACVAILILGSTLLASEAIFTVGGGQRLAAMATPLNDAELQIAELLPVDDVRIQDILDGSRLQLAASCPGFYDVSEYMLGSVAINVILPESDGSIGTSTEDWTQVEQDSVTTQVLAGLSWWATQAKWRDLTFQVLFSYSVPTGYEPINRTADEESLWVCDVLEQMGYAEATYPLALYARANDLRDSLGTDWALLIFVVDSSNDPDGLFADGAAAYAYLGGPNVIMSYKNGNAGIEHMDYIISHEILHSFYAVNEFGAGAACSLSYGYLNVENQNSAWPYAGACALNLPSCILRMQSWNGRGLCTYSKGHIGWWDSDGDSICNVLDTFPETVLDPYSPDPSSTPTPTYTGLAKVIPLPNLNTHGPRHDVTLETVSHVMWRVDEGDWHLATPADGSWDQTEEVFTFTTDSLGAGTHLIEARAFQTCGNSDTSFACDTLTLDTAGVGPEAVGREATISIMPGPNPFAVDLELTYAVPGEPGENIPVSVVVYDVSGREIRRLVEGYDRPGLRKVSWDGKDTSSRPAPSGIYFIRLTAEAVVATEKVVLTR